MTRRGDYGYDAPYVLLWLLSATLIGAAGLATGLVLEIGGLAWAGVWMFAIDLACAGSFLYATRRGKHVIWQRLVRELALRGDETVLDVGCGRGAVLTLVAAELPRGKAIGVDIWNPADQSGNAEAVTRRNAELERVSDRIELVTADMRELPLADASVDVVVSSLAIHNLKALPDRRHALAEIHRVLRPGGRFVIVDIRHARSYAAELARLGDTATVRALGPRLWFGGPHFAARAALGTRR